MKILMFRGKCSEDRRDTRDAARGEPVIVGKIVERGGDEKRRREADQNIEKDCCEAKIVFFGLRKSKAFLFLSAFRRRRNLRIRCIHGEKSSTGNFIIYNDSIFQRIKQAICGGFTINFFSLGKRAFYGKENLKKEKFFR